MAASKRPSINLPSKANDDDFLADVDYFTGGYDSDHHTLQEIMRDTGDVGPSSEFKSAENEPHALHNDQEYPNGTPLSFDNRLY